MTDDIMPLWHTQFIRSADIARAGNTSDFYRAVAAGRVVRIARGVHLPVSVWNALDQDDRYLARVHGTAISSTRGLVFSHISAAALWGLPNIDPWPERIHVVVDAASGGRSRVAFSAHADGAPEVVASVNGLAVTALGRTVVDVGRTLKLSSAVAMADRALTPKPLSTPRRDGATVTMEQLRVELAEVGSRRGAARCTRMLNLADGDSGSPGESLSRVGMYVLGLPVPILQQPFWDTDGFIGTVDFWWPSLGLVGEFDGRGKYLRDEFLQGRSTADVVIAEKIREDRLRAVGCGVTRWGWDVARSLSRLGEHLRRAGVR